MLQLKQERGVIKLHHIHFLHSLQSEMASDNDEKQILLIERLKQALQKGDWRGNRACLTMRNRDCYLRLVTLPPMSRHELKKALYWEVKKHFPLEPEEAVISYVPATCDYHTNGPVQKFLLAACREKTADTYTRLAVQAGLNPVSLEAPPTAVLRSIKSMPGSALKDNQAFNLFIDCGFNTTSLLLTQNGSLLFHRMLYYGVKSFLRTGDKSSKNDLKSALHDLYKKGSLSDKGIIETAVKLKRVVTESLQYWSEQDKANLLSPVSFKVGGGGMLIPGLVSFLEQELGLKAEIYNPISATGGDRVNSTGLSYQHGILFHAAHGLALRGWLK